MPLLRPVRPLQAVRRPITYADLRRAAMVTRRGMGAVMTTQGGDAVTGCMPDDFVGPLAPGEVYCSSGGLVPLSVLPISTPQTLANAVAGSPISYVQPGAGGNCFSYAFPFVGTLDGALVCQPMGGISKNTGTIISAVLGGLFLWKILGGGRR